MIIVSVRREVAVDHLRDDVRVLDNCLLFIIAQIIESVCRLHAKLQECTVLVFRAALDLPRSHCRTKRVIVLLDLFESQLLFLSCQVAVFIYVCRAIDGINLVFLVRRPIHLIEVDIEVRTIVIDCRRLTGVVYLSCLNDECRDVVIRSQGVCFATLLSEVTCCASLVVRG